MNKGVFVAGTGTDVGKTYVSAILLKREISNGVKAAYFKPALSGAENGVPGDAAYVCEAAGLGLPPKSLVPYLFQPAVSPHLAARLEGKIIDTQVILEAFHDLSERFDYIVAEGAGGVACPYRLDGETLLQTDVIKLLGLETVIVSRSGLGAINDAVLTDHYLKANGIVPKGFIMNQFVAGDMLHEDNKATIEILTGTPILMCVPSTIN